MTRSILFLVKMIISLLLGFFHSKINVPIPYVATWMALQYIFGRNTEQEENRRPEHRSSWLRLAVTFYIGYVSGEMEVPIGIFLIGLFVHWWLHPEDQTSSEKEEDIQVTALVDQNEEEDKSEGISQRILPEIARILNTTDEDARIEDLNKIVIELWPYFGQYIKNLLVDWYEPMICRKCKSFRFTRVDMGEKVPLITDARLHITEKKQVVLDLDLSYDGNAVVKISLGRRYFRVGAKQVAVVGTLRVVLAPLMDEIPLFGSLTWFLPRRPDVFQVNWSGIRHLLKIPKAEDFLANTALSYGVDNFVAPNCVPTKLLKTFRLDSLFFRVTRNIIRVHILEAENLISEDSGKFCPYVVISGAQQKGKTQVAKRSHNPSWNQSFEMRFNDLPMQEIEIALFHHGKGRDRCLNRWKFHVEEVISQKVIDKWLSFQYTGSGRLHVILKCLELGKDATELQKVMVTNRISRPMQLNRFSSAVIFILVEEAKDLKVKDNAEMPTSHVVTKVGKHSHSGKECSKTESPKWRAKSSFLLEKPHEETVKIKVKGTGHGILGSFILHISDLLLAKNLTIEGWHQLEAPFPQGTIWIRFELRILVPPRGPEFSMASSS